MNSADITLDRAMRIRRWRSIMVVTLTVLGIAVLLALAFWPWSQRFCSRHQVGCSLLTGFVSTALIALFGYFLLFVWVLQRATKRYRVRATEAPERLFVSPPQVRAAAAVGRDRLKRSVSQEAAFSRRGAPILIVGDPGSGKSTFLVMLTAWLASMELTPVPISLRGAALPLSFRALAERRFGGLVDPDVRSEADAQRVWRTLSARGSVVVLADDLDEVASDLPTHERDYVIRAALLAARNDSLPVVIASRPEAVPLGADVSVFELDPLGEPEAVAYLERRLGLKAGSVSQELSKVLKVGEVSRTPFYLNVIASLYRARRHPSVDGGARDSILTEMLESWVDLLKGGVLLPEVEIEVGQREAIIQDLEAIAYSMTLGSTLVSEIADLDSVDEGTGRGWWSVARRWSGHRLADVWGSRSQDVEAPRDLRRSIEGATRLDLVDAISLAGGTGVRFSHAIIQSYFTSRYLRRHPEAWRSLVQETSTPEMLRALLMWCAHPGIGRRADQLCAAMIRRAALLADDRGLSLAATVVQISDVTGSSRLAKAAAEQTKAAWRAAGPRGRLAAIRQLEGQASPSAVRVLYRGTRDSTYRVRWAAAKAIVQGGADAYSVMKRAFTDTVAYAASTPVSRWSDEKRHEISVLGWILPPLARSVPGTGIGEPETLVRQLADLVGRDMPLGTEASLAQGFKLDALLHRSVALSDLSIRLLQKSVFWYSRIMLLQALCISSVEDPVGKSEAIDVITSCWRNRSEHPFVRETARLCLKAIKARGWTPYVWEDENGSIRHSGSALADESAALVGDVVLLLNVTEQGLAQEDRKNETYRSHELPYCLGASADRHEFFGGCHEPCWFDLCPYPSTPDAILARGEFSQAFCRHQAERLSLRHRFSWRGRGVRQGWWTAAGRSALKDFWEQLESRVG